MINFVCVIFGALGCLLALRYYIELWKWARQCQHARIAIAFKRKVQLQAPLIEWLLWINQLDNDKDSSGRVVYRNGGVSVAITKAAGVHPSVRGFFIEQWQRLVVKFRKPPKPETQTAPVREIGSWAAKDETSEENKNVG